MTQRMFGPGSQPADDALDVLAVPREVSTFRMPEVPPAADASALARARAIFEDFHAKLVRWDPCTDVSGPYADLGAVPADVLALVNPMLGEGEVSVRIAGSPGPEYRIQESVFTGLWRVCDLPPRRPGRRLDRGRPAAARGARRRPPVRASDAAGNDLACRRDELAGAPRGDRGADAKRA